MVRKLGWCLGVMLLVGVAVACGTEVLVEDGAAGANGAGANGAGASGALGVEGDACGTNADCSSDLYCGIDPCETEGICGSCGGEGVCLRRDDHDVCLPARLCGCDGQVYQSYCDASAAGVRVEPNGDHTTCATPAGMMKCGNQFCLQDGEYCKIIQGSGYDVSYECHTFDGCVGDPCTCAVLLAADPNLPYFCSDMCTPTDDGGIAVECSWF